MFSVKRNIKGNITSIHQASGKDSGELKTLMDKEVIEFLEKSNDQESKMGFLSVSDIGTIRVIEDLIDVLVKKHIILFTDLPESAQLEVRVRT